MSAVHANYDDQGFAGSCPTCGQSYLVAEVMRLRSQNERLRNIISNCAAAVGAFVSPECSLAFMENLPNEIRMKVARVNPALGETK